MRTAIVADSNCGILEKEAKQLGVFVVPMPVIVGGHSYLEGVDLDHGDFYRKLTEKVEITTSQAMPEDVSAMWERLLREGYDEVLYLPMSSGLSSSFQTARMLAEEYEGRVQVADVHRISVTQRHAVLDAIALIGQGLGAAEARRILEENAMQSIVFLGVDDIGYLKRGGRITPAAAAMASVLQIKPLLVMRGEQFDSYAKVRGRNCCQKRLIEAVSEQAETYRSQGQQVRIGVAGSFLSEEDTENWTRMVHESFPNDEVLYDPLTMSVSCHTGPNAFGMGISVKPGLSQR